MCVFDRERERKRESFSIIENINMLSNYCYMFLFFCVDLFKYFILLNQSFMKGLMHEQGINVITPAGYMTFEVCFEIYMHFSYILEHMITRLWMSFSRRGRTIEVYEESI